MQTQTEYAHSETQDLLINQLIDRLTQQEEKTRRLESTIFALARYSETNNQQVTETPTNSNTRTPKQIGWPKRRLEDRDIQQVSPSTVALKPTPEKIASSINGQSIFDEKHDLDSQNVDEYSHTTDGDILWAIAGLVQDPMVGLDDHGIVRVWNPAAEDLFGWTAEEIIGKPAPFVPEDKIEEHENLCEQARNNKPCHDVATIRRCKDGRLIRLEASVAGLRKGAALTFRAMGVPARPTTAFSMPMGSDASNAVDLNEIPQDLHLHALAAVGRQSASISHDFNNLLAIISGGIQTLIEQFDGDDSRKAVIEMINFATNQAKDVCKRMMDLSRVGYNRKAKSERSCDLSAVISSHKPLLEGLIGRNRSLEMSLTNKAAEVNLNPSKVGQILINLATNSRDAMTEGGTLAVEVDIINETNASIPINVPCVILTVSDTGCGMDSETLGRAFEPFFSTKYQHNGTGLGLANVAEIVKQANGVVLPESSPGTGTTIRIYLPLSSDSVES